MPPTLYRSTDGKLYRPRLFCCCRNLEEATCECGECNLSTIAELANAPEACSIFPTRHDYFPLPGDICFYESINERIECEGTYIDGFGQEQSWSVLLSGQSNFRIEKEGDDWALQVGLYLAWDLRTQPRDPTDPPVQVPPDPPASCYPDDVPSANTARATYREVLTGLQTCRELEDTLAAGVSVPLWFTQGALNICGNWPAAILASVPERASGPCNPETET